MQDTVIVGEAVAGEAAKTRKALEKAIRQVNLSTFDIIELLHKVRSGRMYSTPTFEDYLKTLEIKRQTAKYLERIGEFMATIHATREEAEVVGVTKMRVISRLDPTKEYTNPLTKETCPMLDYVWGLMEAAPKQTADQLAEQVRILMGEVGENDLTWLNIRLSRLLMENVVKPAFEKAAINLGTVGHDKDGIAVEPSDARKLEIICVAYKQDKSEDPEVTS